MSVLHKGTDYIVSPGEILEDILTSRGISIDALSQLTLIPQSKIELLIDGKCELTSDTDYEMWTNLQVQYGDKLNS